jgi:hypothetical protein
LEIVLDIGKKKKKKEFEKLTSFKVPAVLDRATGCKSRLLCHPNWGFLGLLGGDPAY